MAKIKIQLNILNIALLIFGNIKTAGKDQHTILSV